MLEKTKGFEALTPRQLQVARLAPFYSNQEIAERLNITPRSAKAHIETILVKLDLERKREIGLYLRERGEL